MFHTRSFPGSVFPGSVFPRNVRMFSVALGMATVFVLTGGETMAQCSGGGGGGGRMPTGSPATFNPNAAYASSPLVSSAANSLAMQYQQSVLAQRQAYAMAYQNSQQQQLTLRQRNAELYETRLANAEAKRAAKAERIAARLRARNQSGSSYMLTSTEIETEDESL
ncbi:MAG: hypothetical protein ACF8CQ_11525 [Rhodopirellula sp. JB044]|uniref:hypothetical protein n=1 Tax=Rhodopirellula sp. JB044 TaxID=3342844 RepID=UPI00370B22DD